MSFNEPLPAEIIYSTKNKNQIVNSGNFKKKKNAPIYRKRLSCMIEQNIIAADKSNGVGRYVG